ncbi:MAG: glycosyltransferase [Sphaerospermopsis kisseleviana]
MYNEVMGYLLAGLRTFYRQYPDVQIHLFELDSNKLTPFHFDDSRLHYYKKSNYKSFSSFKNICDEISPSLLIVSGRSNNHYLKIAKMYRKKILTVSIQDSQDDHTLKVFFKSITAPVFYHPYFTCIWTIGPYGNSLAHKLWYRKEDIYNFCLTADTEIYHIDSELISKEKQRQILYVGRFSDEKNITTLIKVFKKVNRQQTIKWKLRLVGNGNLQNQLTDLSDIEIYPFKTANELKILAEEADIFCLPSKYEPWGVVVHEFAALGKALLISTKCGSRQTFLIDGFNGFSFKPMDPTDLEAKLKFLISLSDEKLLQFKKNSILLSKQISPILWAAQLNSLYQRSINVN